jgi:hypothetical protein
MRTMLELTSEELDKVNEILKKEYNYHIPLKCCGELEYQCFSKSHAIYSGYGIVRVYEYLKSIDIDIFKYDHINNL